VLAVVRIYKCKHPDPHFTGNPGYEMECGECGARRNGDGGELGNGEWGHAPKVAACLKAWEES
jgi:hypothetical protein